MPWGGAGGQNIEHPHTLAIQASYAVRQQLLLARLYELACQADMLPIELPCPVYIAIRVWEVDERQ